MEACRLCDRAARLFEDTPERQFARVAKGVDLRSTEGNFAWVRTPQLTTPWDFEGPCRLVVRTSRCGRDNPGSNPGEGILNTECCLRAWVSPFAPRVHLGGSLHPSRSATKTLTSYV